MQSSNRVAHALLRAASALVPTQGLKKLGILGRKTGDRHDFPQRAVTASKSMHRAEIRACRHFSILVFALALPVAAQQFGLPAMVRGVGIDQNLNAQLPLETTFKDETGQTVRLGQYFRDKPVVLALVYYECPSSATWC